MDKLNIIDVNFILINVKLTDYLHSKLEKLKNNTLQFDQMTLEDLDMIRDSCGEELQIDGFDENYQLTEKGELLENLIDKLYVK